MKPCIVPPPEEENSKRNAYLKLAQIIDGAKETLKKEGRVLVNNLEESVGNILLNLKYDQQKIVSYLNEIRKGINVKVLRTPEEIENYGVRLAAFFPIIYCGGYYGNKRRNKNNP